MTYYPGNTSNRNRRRKSSGALWKEAFQTVGRELADSGKQVVWELSGLKKKKPRRGTRKKQSYRH